MSEDKQQQGGTRGQTAVDSSSDGAGAGRNRGGAGDSDSRKGAEAGGNRSRGGAGGQGRSGNHAGRNGRSHAANSKGGGKSSGKSGSNGGANRNANGGHNRSANRGGNKRREPAVCNKGEHILFVGFMGCGKSSVSRVLHKRCGLPLVDIDKFIVQREGRSINQIFAEEGEAGFRRIETMTLASLAFEEKSIISCGGGICGSAVNRGIVKALGTVVYLKVPCNEAVGRISDPSTRPMLNGERPVREIYDERLPLYRDVADITINTSGKSVGANVQQVIGALRRRGLL